MDSEETRVREIVTGFLRREHERILGEMRSRLEGSGSPDPMAVHGALFEAIRAHLGKPSTARTVRAIRSALVAGEGATEIQQVIAGQMLLWEILHEQLRRGPGPHQDLAFLHVYLMAVGDVVDGVIGVLLDMERSGPVAAIPAWGILKDLGRMHRESRFVDRLSRELLEARDPQELFLALERGILATFHLRSLMIAAVDHGAGVVEVVRNYPPNPVRDPVGWRYELSLPDVLCEVVRRKAPEIIDGPDPRYHERAASADGGFEFRRKPTDFNRGKTAYFVPILARDRVAAVICTGSPTANRPSVLREIDRMRPFLDRVGSTLSLVSEIAERKQAEAAHDRTLRREEAMGRLRDAIVGMRHLSEFHQLLDGEWIEELRGLGVPVREVSLQFPSPRPGFFQNLPDLIGLVHRAHKPLSSYPWVQEVWQGETPLLVEPDRFQGLGFDPEVRRILEVPLPGMNASLGVNTDSPTAFGPEEVRTLQVFAGLIAEGWRRVQDFELLKASEARFRDLYDQAPVGYHECDARGTLVRVNRTALDMLGYGVEEMLGRPVWDFLLEKEGSRLAIATKMSGLEPLLPYHRTWVRRDGSTFPASMQDQLLRDPSGGVIGLRSTIQDITEPRKSEDRLRESEAFLQAVFDGIEDGICVLDPDMKILRANRIMEQWYEHMIPLEGKLCYRAFQGREEPCEVCPTRRARDTGLPHRDEVPLHGPDGPSGWLELSTFPVLGPDGRPRMYIEHVRDITARRRTEEERYRLSMAVEQAAESVIITDLEGTIVYANPACEKVSGYSRDELTGRNIRILKSGKHEADFYQDLWEALGRGEVWSGRFTNKRKDGTLYEEEAVISPVRSAAGAIVNYVAVKRDITQEASLEAQLRQAQKMEAVGTLAGGVAHDFNNILTTITGFAQMALLEEGMDDRAREYIVRIPEQVQRASKLISQLLTFSRHTAVDRQPLSLDLLAKETLKLLHRTLPESISVRGLIPEGGMMITADPTQMQQVILNLCVNASQAMPEGGELRLACKRVSPGQAQVPSYLPASADGYICLSVRDTGIGMSAEIQERIFEPFFTTKEAGKGTGLGLAIVYGIVKAHDGYIEVESEVGRGTEFRVHLPAVSEAVAEAPPPALPHSPDGRETLLLVEDEEAVLDIERRMLERLGYTVLTAANGEEALRVYRANRDRIAMVMTDVVMPKMGGRELCRHLRELKPDIRVVLISGYSFPGDPATRETDGARAFVGKPFDLPRLAQTIRMVLDG